MIIRWCATDSRPWSTSSPTWKWSREAGDGDEAIALYEQHRPDVMVLDLRMPKRDGVAVVQRVLELASARPASSS